jgi:TM2 domain-containing membrane protein YozV
MKFIRLLLLLLVFGFAECKAQTNSAVNNFDVSFANYLIQEKLFADATTYLLQFKSQYQPNAANNYIANSDYFYAVEKLKFEKKDFTDSLFSWRTTSDSVSKITISNSTYSHQLLFYYKLNLLHQAYSVSAENIELFFHQPKNKNAWKLQYSKPEEESAHWQKIFLLQDVTLQLMLHDTVSAKNSLQTFQKSYPKQYAHFIENVNTQIDELQKIKSKNVLKAGLLSAALPGAGKMYYGNNGQGFSALITSLLIAAEAYSGFKKQGYNTVHGWTYAGLFSIFYVGNIWGTVIGLKVKQRKAYENINHNLLDNADRLIEQL